MHLLLSVTAQSDWTLLKRAMVFIVALLAAYLANIFLGSISRGVAKFVMRSLDRTPSAERFLRTRRMETFMSLGVAVGRVLVVLVALFVAWQLTNPSGTPIALIGASTVFAVIAGATLVPILRDLTYGFTMVAERWYHVGDHVVVEPFPHLGGVVEEVTLRSTRLRSVNGEVIRVHNQNIQAVRVSTAASHTLALETFVNDPVVGKEVIIEAIKVIPRNATTIPQAPVITEVKKLSDKLWRITVICEVTPYREWIIENFAVEAIKKCDELTGLPPVIVHGPLAMYADSTAEKRYQRSVRAHRAHVAKRRTTKPSSEAA